MSDDEVLAILSNLDTRKLSTRFISQNQDLNTPTARILLNIILIAVVSAFLKHTYSLDRLVQQVGNAIFNLGILQPTLHTVNRWKTYWTFFGKMKKLLLYMS